jgi:anti-sigma factor RsiW
MSPRDEDMRCEIALDHLEAFLDDELPSGFAVGLRRHLSTCPSCAEELEGARRTINALRALPELDPPARLIGEVRREVGIDDGRRSVFQSRRNRVLAAAAAILVSVLGGITVSLHDRRSDTDALRSAAEIEYALACVGEITRRANHTAAARVIDRTSLSSTFDGVNRTIDLTSRLLPNVAPSSDSKPIKGSS